MLSLAGPLLSTFSVSPKTFRAAEAFLCTIGLALLYAVFVRAIQHVLSLFDTVYLLHDVGLAFLAVPPSWCKGGRVKKFFAYTFYCTEVFGFVIFIIYMLAVASRFGPKLECNKEVKFILFKVGVSIINIVVRLLLIATLAFLIPCLACPYS